MSATERTTEPPAARPGWEPEPLPAAGVRRWAVWSACRGSSALLAQIARAAMWEVARADGEASCLIEVGVRDDVERALSPDDVAGLSPEALRRFAWIRMRVRGMSAGVDVLMAREPVPARAGVRGLEWDQVPAVVLEAAAPDGARAEAVRAAVAAAIDRGAFAFLHAEPIEGEGTAGPEAAARARVTNRREAVGGLYVLTVLAVVGVLYAVTQLAAELDYGDDAAFAGATVATIGYAAALGASFRWPRFSAGVRRRVDRVVFPAVEIADRTPGRRVVRLGFRVASLALVPLAGALAQQVGRAMGLLG